MAMANCHGHKCLFTVTAGLFQCWFFTVSIRLPVKFTSPLKALLGHKDRDDLVDDRRRRNRPLNDGGALRRRPLQDGDRDAGEYQGHSGVGQ